jgi:hypothetical protein
MFALTFIRDRILSPAPMLVRPATPATHRGARCRQALGSAHSRSSHALSGSTSGPSTGIERLGPVRGATTRQTAGTPLTGVALATSALTFSTTRRIVSNITG